ncbi:MAG: response regulator, partial [Pseudomonadota bacterium]
LAMVYGIVKSHGGHIICSSEPGAGTTFNIYLPVDEEEMDVDGETGRGFSVFGTGTILLVDDEQFVRDLGKRVLEKAGYTVIEASNGREAVEVYEARGKNISLIILDLIMPLMDGRQCLQELLKIDPEVRVLIASGYSADGPPTDFLSVGAKAVVKKPFDMHQLLEMVRKTIHEV